MRVAMAGIVATGLLLEPSETSLGSYSDVDQATRIAMARAHPGTLPGAPVLDLNLKPSSRRVADDLAAAVQHAIAVERDAAEQLLRMTSSNRKTVSRRAVRTAARTSAAGLPRRFVRVALRASQASRSRGNALGARRGASGHRRRGRRRRGLVEPAEDALGRRERGFEDVQAPICSHPRQVRRSP